MKKAEEYLKQYQPLRMYGTEYIHKETVLKVIRQVQKETKELCEKSLQTV